VLIRAEAKLSGHHAILEVHRCRAKISAKARGILPSGISPLEVFMVLTKSELISSLQNESRILLHLITKVDPNQLDYRPTPKQRSTVELVRYLSVMGPGLVRAGKAGSFDPAVWTAALQAAETQTLDGLRALIAAHHEAYATLLADVADADFRFEIEMFGSKRSRGAFLVNSVLSGCAAYRTQLFLYLKACGRVELTTMNLWAGMDAPPPA
jgi:hypothetical protein